MNSTSGGGFDWPQPVSSITQTADAMDWSAPVTKFGDDELKLDWGDDDAVNGVDDDCGSEVERQDKLKGPSVDAEQRVKSKTPELVMVNYNGTIIPAEHKRCEVIVRKTALSATRNGRLFICLLSSPINPGTLCPIYNYVTFGLACIFICVLG